MEKGEIKEIIAAAAGLLYWHLAKDVDKKTRIENMHDIERQILKL